MAPSTAAADACSNTYTAIMRVILSSPWLGGRSAGLAVDAFEESVQDLLAADLVFAGGVGTLALQGWPNLMVVTKKVQDSQIDS